MDCDVENVDDESPELRNRHNDESLCVKNRDLLTLFKQRSKSARTLDRVM